jgi:hypothetical protein
MGGITLSRCPETTPGAGTLPIRLPGEGWPAKYARHCGGDVPLAVHHLVGRGPALAEGAREALVVPAELPGVVEQAAGLGALQALGPWQLAHRVAYTSATSRRGGGGWASAREAAMSRPESRGAASVLGMA